MAKYTVEDMGGGVYRVMDTEADVYITHDCPKDIADEIAADFNAMANKDFSPLGGPDLSRIGGGNE